ncbi:ATP-binding protein [Hyphomonas sp.]|uniref:ATP-binding protein n=1 Tax=Hyphomonas sp. TaxID=87 RepID=UPI00391CC47D
MDASLLDLLPLVVCETAPVRDDQGNIIDLEWVDANRLMNESILPEGGSIVGMRVFEFDPAYRESDMVKNVIEVIETGEPRTFITGKGRAAAMLGKVMKTIITPSPRGAIACSHEITDIAEERDRALNRLNLARAACDYAIHGIVITDANSNIRYVNHAITELLGYCEKDLVGENVGVIFGVKTLNPEVALSSKAISDIEDGKLIRQVADAEAVTKDGERIRVQASTSSAHWGDTGNMVFITYIRDVREERRRAHELRDALHRAEQATRLKSEFLANMSHEIRTPLNGVLGMAQVLTHSGLSPQQAEQVNVILESGKTLMVLLNDILDLSKIEAGRLEMSPVPGDVRHKLSSLFRLHETAAKEKGIGLRLHVDPSVPSRLVFDPVRIRQCISNLVSNAIKFTSKGEVLTVMTAAETGDGDHLVTVHVTDTGCGIDNAKLDRIFESFAQEDGSTTRKFGGTGLGLSITRKLARLMGGDVTVVSEPGRGSVFTLTFRAEAADMMHPAASSKPELRPVKATRAGLTGCRALVVDDNGINRRVARSFLEYYGIVIGEAADGHQALEALQREPWDIVLMDIHMPGLDGAEAFRRLRLSDSPGRMVPVIALTADSMHGDREKYLAMGFDGYVSKPIDERTLTAMISRLLSVPVEDRMQVAS